MVIVTVIVRVAGTMARKLPSEASTTELDQLCPLVCPQFRETSSVAVSMTTAMQPWR